MMEMMIIISMLSKMKFSKIMIQNSIFFLTFNFLFYLGNMNMEIFNIYMFNYMDKYCSLLILLTFWITSISLMITNKDKLIMIYTLMVVVNLTFSSSNLIMFYIWFESSLIPLFIMIFWWGKSKERSLASMYMLMYTMLGSLPLLMTIFTMYKMNNSTEWDYLMMYNMKTINMITYWNMIIAFLIKIPVFGFHIWLPKAHVEAPVYGSMILASIILKMGSMGLMRMMMTSLNMSMKFNLYIMMILMSGTLMMSLLCILQLDMKSIVAYSSVVHMGIVTISMMTMFKWGYSGAYIMMIAHGLCSSSMFYIVNVMYTRSNSRIIIMNKGMININPSLTCLWFISCVNNLGAPISLNFFSELMMTNSIIVWSFSLIIIMMLINIFSSIYSMNLFMMSCHGKLMSNKFLPIKMIEYHTIILHLIPLNLLPLNSWMWNMNF